MSYAEMNELYRGSDRNRYEMCIREQAAATYSADPLGQSVIAGDLRSIDAMIAAVTTGPNWNTLAEDAALLSAVQSSWAVVSNALYPV